MKYDVLFQTEGLILITALIIINIIIARRTIYINIFF